MVVQTRTITDDDVAIELIEIPENLSNNVIEDESILMLESKIDKLKNNIVITAKSLFKYINELKTQASEIEQLRYNNVSMNELVGKQNDRIDELEKKDNLASNKFYDIIDKIEKQEIQTSFKFDNFVEKFETEIMQISQKIDVVTKEVDKNQTKTKGQLDSITDKIGQIENQKNDQLDSITNKIAQIDNQNNEQLERINNKISQLENQNNEQLERITERLENNESQMPDELKQVGFNSLRANIGHDILDKLKNSNCQFFEDIILELLPKMGYGKGEIINRSREGRIDGFINPDELGCYKIYFRAYKLNNGDQINTHMINNFVGTLELAGVNKGIIITTSNFENNLEQVIKNSSKTIIPINGNKLVDIITKHNIGINTEEHYDTQKVDSGFLVKES